ncbi:MAG TPA: S9 family peptidase, partial [Acidimicrobiales bacterium]|nr:S9 family peptidase [Acidimicrobiales bacterium]
MSDTFPRQYARTRRFSLGSPRNLTISPDGRRVVFLRSASGEDPRTSLWVLDVANGEERLVVDASEAGGTTEMTGAEKALRERTRESAEGITSYSADREVGRVVCLHNGALVVADLATAAVETLECAPSAFGPVISPDGRRVAYVAGSALRVTGPGDPDRVLAADESPTVSWGQAEFIAAEEMGRTRGFWWSPESDRLAVTRVDVDPVPTWWISHPVDPATAPNPVRYPAAGERNARVELSVIGLDGSRTDVLWDRERWEYLASVRWSDDGLQVTLQSRDQRDLLFARVDPDSGALENLAELSDPSWVELIPGAPVLCGERLITVEERDGNRRLCVDGSAVTPGDMWVRSVADADSERIVFTASVEPTRVEVHEYRLAEQQLVTVVGSPGVHSVVAEGSTLVVSSRSLDSPGVRVTVIGEGGTRATIGDRSARPLVEPRPEMLRTARRDIRVAVLLPERPHDGPLPILMDPYGGPHAQRVLESTGSFLVSQWFADQGFAVVVADGRGTPGRGGDWERAVAGDLAGPVLEDQIEALETVVGRYGDRVDPSRVGIRG